MANNNNKKNDEKKVVEVKAEKRVRHHGRPAAKATILTPEENDAYSRYIDAELQLLAVQKQYESHTTELVTWSNTVLGINTPVGDGFFAMIMQVMENVEAANHVPTEALFMQPALRINLNNRLLKLRAMTKYMARCENTFKYCAERAGVVLEVAEKTDEDNG